MVARLNDLAEARLEAFLFGAERIPTGVLRPGLLELQRGECFYCSRRMRTDVDVDHFIPWVRYPDNGIANLVAAHSTCNSAKRDFLAAEDHVERWVLRAADPLILDIARAAAWREETAETLSVARAIYLRLPKGAKLWVSRDRFADADLGRLGELLVA